MTCGLKAPAAVRPIIRGGRIGGRDRIEISGPPGCGKSTLAQAMAEEYRRHGKAVEILEDGKRLVAMPANPDVIIVTRHT